MGHKHIPYKPHDIAGKIALGFLKNPLTALFGFFLLLMGYFSISVMPREEDPQIAISGGSVIVQMAGSSAKEIENVIVGPLERKFKEVSGVQHIYGTAVDNMGIINVVYSIGENREDSNLKIYDKVMQNMDKMPLGASNPLVKPFDIDIDIPVVTVAFYAKKESVSDVDIFKKVDKIQREINALEGVAKTGLKGDHKPQYNIEVSLDNLLAHNISLNQIYKAVSSITSNMPNVKGETKGKEIVVFGVKNVIESTDDVGDIVISRYKNSPVYLKDVATITDGSNIQKYNDAKLIFRDDKTQPFSEELRQVTLSVSKLAGKNSVVVADLILDILEQEKEQLLQSDIGFLVTRNYGIRANEAVSELMHHLVITIGVIAVMLIFVLGWKESLIVTFTVPAILAITLFIAYLTGQTINRITLFALLLSLGLLVDAAIIVIENIHRHLHEKGHSTHMEDLIVEATDEIGPPTSVATLAIIFTMLPMAFIGDMMGSFMKPIPYNVPVAVLASMFVAYVFTPYLSLKLLNAGRKDDKHV